MKEGNDIKTAAIIALKNEFSQLRAEECMDMSHLNDDKLMLFGKTFLLRTFSKIKKTDLDELRKSCVGNQDISDYLLLTTTISTDMAEFLRREDISFCDSNATMQINVGGMKLMNVNVRMLPAATKSLNLNTTASLKVILCLLRYGDAVNWPMRKLAEISGVSLGTVQRVMEVLKINAAVFLTPKGRFLKNKELLLNIWVDGFNSILLPKIILGRAIFRNVDQKSNWQNFKLIDRMMWGGEAAAQILDGYLLAQDLSIFTSEDFRTTVKKLNLAPVGQSGYITVLKKFWKDFEESNESAGIDVAPVLVVYAQLMGMHDSRCQDAARRLLKQYMNQFRLPQSNLQFSNENLSE